MAMQFNKIHQNQQNQRLSRRLELRLSDSDYSQIQAKASQVNLSMSEFMRRAALRKAMSHPLAAFDLKAYQILCQIDAQLRIAGNNLNQIAKACNSAVVLGEPVVVNTGLLERVQELTRSNKTAIKTIVAAVAQSTIPKHDDQQTN